MRYRNSKSTLLTHVSYNVDRTLANAKVRGQAHALKKVRGAELPNTPGSDISGPITINNILLK